MFLWEKITFLGDSVVLLPVAFIIAVWLVVSDSRQLAAIWCALLGIGLLIVVASKIAFIGWGIGIESLDFTGFSGHAMRATAILPVVPFVLLQQAPRRLLIGVMSAAGGLAALICVSRLSVHAHSMSEVAGGAALGALVSCAFILLAQGRVPPIRHRWLIAAELLGMLGTAHADPAPTQRWMVGIALYMSGHDRPYDRSYWNTRTCSIERADLSLSRPATSLGHDGPANDRFVAQDMSLHDAQVPEQS